MEKVVFIPLDERPCNYHFPYQLFHSFVFDIRRPERHLMGDKKIPGNLDGLQQFILEEAKDAYGLVIAIDTLLYGGIVPSRLHHDSVDTLEERLNVLKTIKAINPSLKIFAYHLIMRCPQYSLSDEEPDYYDICGKEIFLTGYYTHKKQLGIATGEELNQLESLNVPKEYLNDYLERRKKNTELTRKSVQLVEEGIIDFLIIPQDDSAEYGWTAMDQEIIRQDIRDKQLQYQVYMYPGADEVANVLLSRMMTEKLKRKPVIYLRYNSYTAPQTIPSLEDRYLDTTIKYQVLASGGLIASSVHEADAVLFVNAPADQMISAPYQYERKGPGFTTQRNMVEMIEYMDYCVNVLKKPAIVADVAFGNGSDIEFVQLIEAKGLLMKVAAYAGWNTSSNSLGTCIPQGIIYTLLGEGPNHKSFLALRYIEDVGYCALIRRKVAERDLTEHGMNYFDVKEERGMIASIVKQELIEFMKKFLPSLAPNVEMDDVYMPWRRMYEVGIQLRYIEES